MEKRKSYACAETFSPLREHEFTGKSRYCSRSLFHLFPILQVSSGVSVAYFSSIVLLLLAATSSPSPDGHADTSTYFDSVVFLTMFLLAGMPLVRRNE